MKSAYRAFFAFIWVLILTACGGGGSLSADTDSQAPEDVDVVSVTLAITNTEITAAAPATITATVMSSLNGPVANTLVTFTLNDATLGTLTPEAGTALTNTNGVATVELASLSIKGAGTVTAKVKVGERESNAVISFNSAGDVETLAAGSA